MTSTPAAPAPAPARAPAKTRRTLLAGSVGNALEWYDFAIYGFLAPIIAPLFFPSDDPTASLLAVYGAFAAGYLARPLGAALFGYVGDRYGRRVVLLITVTMMGICSLAIGLLPTAEAIGATAGLLLLVLRVLQGISVGGEFTGSSVFIAETAPPEKRGFYASFIVAGAVGGFLLGSLVATALTNFFDDEAIKDGLWRVPFMAGILIMGLCAVLRRSVSDAPAHPAQEAARSPLVDAFTHHWRDLLRIMGLVIANAVTFYMLFTYAASYLTDIMHVSTATALDISTLTLVVMLLAPILAAWVSDKVGRRPLALLGTGGLVLTAYPFWWLIHHQDPVVILAGQVGMTLVFSIYVGLIPVMLAELSKAAVRVSVSSIGYNMTLALFGGLTPLVVTWLVARTADDFVPAYVIMLAAAISFATILFTVPETRGQPLTSRTDERQDP
ncbi:MAG: MFS transporter [Pseudomonadota bacterium]